MTLLIKGIDRLSQLLIDADKDWNTKGITNIKQVAALMSRGDLIARDTSILVRIQAGPDGYVLTSTGVGKLPTWAPAGGGLKYYFPAIIDSADAETVIAAPDHSIPKNALLGAVDVEAWDNQPGLLISRTVPILDSVDVETVIAAADHSSPSNGRVKSALSILCDGFVEEAAFDVGTHDAADSLTIMTDSVRLHWVADALIGKTIYNTTDGSSGVITDNTEHTVTVVALIGGADQTWQAGDAYIIRTDHTVQARDAAANDLNLCPMSDTQFDKIYIGSRWPFWEVQVQQGTGGAGNWTNVAYYWNGAWAACVDENDGSNSFQHGAGLKLISHTPQVGWVVSVIMGMNLYWMMIQTDNYVNSPTNPLGNQIWVALGG